MTRLDWPGIARTLAIIAGFVALGLAAQAVMGCGQDQRQCERMCEPRPVQVYGGFTGVLSSLCVCEPTPPEPQP